MQLIETKTLASAAASIEFTSIPQDGTDLVAVISARNSTTESVGLISFNGSTTGRTFRYLLGTGSSPSSGTFDGYGFTTALSSYTANTFSNSQVYIPNYTGSTNKSYSLDDVTENNATAAFMLIGAGLWSNTSAITSVTFTASTGNLVAGSTISLYKITKGSDGTTVVS